MKMGTSRPIIYTIGGGKGGVGKSLTAVNLGIWLSRSGMKVLLVDADLGAANLHTFLGMGGSRFSISHFINNKISDVKHLISNTPFKNLNLISGSNDAINIANLNGNRIERFQKELMKINYDYIILDIGPGTSSNMLNFFLMADEGVLMISPEPTSIENTYRFLKCLVMYRIKKILSSQEDYEFKAILQKVFSKKSAQPVKTVSDVFHILKKLDSRQGGLFKSILGSTDISIIVNQIKKSEDKEIGFSVKRACFDYFGFNIEYLGHIFYDESVCDSVRYRKPLVIHYSQSTASRAMEGIARHLLEKRKQKLSGEKEFSLNR